jgi:hypothetical protein
MPRLWNRIFVAFIFLAATGCGLSELPEGKENYAGFWSGPTIGIEITPDATVDYTRGSFDSQTSISGGIVRFEDDDFVVYAVMNFSFDVSEPPHDVDGEEHMTINGEDLVRSF